MSVLFQETALMIRFGDRIFTEHFDVFDKNKWNNHVLSIGKLCYCYRVNLFAWKYLLHVEALGSLEIKTLAGLKRIF